MFQFLYETTKKDQSLVFFPWSVVLQLSVLHLFYLYGLVFQPSIVLVVWDELLLAGSFLHPVVCWLFSQFMLHWYHCHLVPFVFCVRDRVQVALFVINEQIVLNSMLNYDVFAQMNGLIRVLYALIPVYFKLTFFCYSQFCQVCVEKKQRKIDK